MTAAALEKGLYIRRECGYKPDGGPAFSQGAGRVAANRTGAGCFFRRVFYLRLQTALPEVSLDRDTIARCLPFIIYMAFVGVQEGLGWLGARGFIGYDDNTARFLYPVKIAMVALALVVLWKRYSEVRFKGIRVSDTLLSVVVGLVVFVLWINMDWPFAVFGEMEGYDPGISGGGPTPLALLGIRLLGASVIVPLMEEIFWRSFLIRYIINPDFMAVQIGRFTLVSFIISTALFGLEHNMFLAGMMAGAAYTLLLYRTKSIAQCIIAHGITNLALGIYVINTGQWRFW